MKSFRRNILLTAALAVGAIGLNAAQGSDDWREQWHNAKYGRSSPAEEARQNAEQASVAYRDETPGQYLSLTNSWYMDQRHRAKYGRPSASEEARLKAEQESTAFREDTTRDVTLAEENAWFRDQWHRTRFGRPFPAR